MTKEADKTKKIKSVVNNALSKNYYDNYPSNRVEIISKKALERFKQNLELNPKVEDLQFDPLETGLYNDQQIVKHPFIKNMGYHEMSSLAQYKDLYNEYLQNVNNILKKLDEKSPSNACYSSYKKISEILLTNDKEVSSLANAVIRGGMTLDFKNINYFVDYMMLQKNEKNTIQIYNGILSEFKNLEKFAEVKNAEYFILTTYEAQILPEIYLNIYQMANKIGDTSNIMYRYLDLTQDRTLLSEVGLCPKQEPEVLKAVKHLNNLSTYKFAVIPKKTGYDLEFMEPIMAYQDALNQFKCKIMIKLAENDLIFDEVFGSMQDIEQAVKSTPFDDDAEEKSVDARFTFMTGLIKQNYISMLEEENQKNDLNDDTDYDDESDELTTETYKPQLQKKLPGYN